MPVSVILNTIIGTFFACIANIIMGKMILNKKIKCNLKNLFVVIIFISIVSIIQLSYNNFIRTLPLFIITIVVFKILLKEDTDKTIVSAFVTYGILFLGELLYALLASLIFGKDFLCDKNLENNIIINNMCISFISISISLILRKGLRKIVQNISDKRIVINITLCLIIILSLSLLTYKLYSSGFIVDKYFIINGTLIVISFIVGIYLFIQKLKINMVEQNYQRFIVYSKEIEEMVEEYRILQHEFKNQLIIIREMLDNKNKKANDYINTLLEEQNTNRYLWIKELKNIPLDSLKGFLNYKILRMTNLGINIDVMISKEIKDSFIKDFDAKQKRQLYDIIGVYVDNAIEAACESVSKEIKIDMYQNNNTICFVIANSYKGNININKVDEPGFSTKTKGHGYGLTLVKKILESTDIFKQERKISSDLYIQKLFIEFK